MTAGARTAKSEVLSYVGADSANQGLGRDFRTLVPTWAYFTVVRGPVEPTVEASLVLAAIGRELDECPLDCLTNSDLFWSLEKTASEAGYAFFTTWEHGQKLPTRWQPVVVDVTQKLYFDAIQAAIAMQFWPSESMGQSPSPRCGRECIEVSLESNQSSAN